ncbi:hypothetical protein [Winogradskyella sp. 3972H.M.0a.05]|uniref:hypothetical protein n=1 Tax=Winogradskyella sp. 3972H.M.0a.05 TaxID=2950277 RepID=UPI00339B3677
MSVQDIQQKIQNAKALDFGNIFNDSIELFKKVWVQGLVVRLLMIVLSIPLYFVAYIPMIFFGILSGSLASSSLEELGFLALIVMSLIMLFLSLILMVMQFALYAAFYRICMHKDLNIMEREDYFYFFKKRYFSKMFKLCIAVFGISILASLLCVIPLIYAMIPLAFINVIFAFNPEKSISDIIRIAFDLGNKKWLITFGLVMVTLVLAIIFGFLMCLIGTIVTYSFVMLPLYFVYKEVVGFSDDNDQDKIEFRYIEE